MQIFDISPQKKKWKREENIFVNGKQEKNVNKVYVNKSIVCALGYQPPPHPPSTANETHSTCPNWKLSGAS